MRIRTYVNLTWSKLMAFAILGCSMVLDVRNEAATAFMFAVPFVSALILGKQYMDRGRDFSKENKE